jgi:non-homologous end joining protein Ku
MKFEDRYENALVELLNNKRKGERKSEAKAKGAEMETKRPTRQRKAG